MCPDRFLEDSRVINVANTRRDRRLRSAKEGGVILLSLAGAKGAGQENSGEMNGEKNQDNQRGEKGDPHAVIFDDVKASFNFAEKWLNQLRSHEIVVTEPVKHDQS